MKINQKILSLFLVFAIFFVLWVTPKTFSVFNQIVETSFYKIAGEQSVDSSIVVIKISDKDISALGGWPLKRSYYALLINKLNKLGVAKIGLEVFLSDNNSNQEIYNGLIINEIKRKNNILFSSIINNLKLEDEEYQATAVILPEIKEQLKETRTGHINFIEDNGFIIPNSITVENNKVFSFVHSLMDDKTSSELKVNCYSTFDSFKNYSILEFFSAFENNTSTKETFKNKIVLIGVTDPTIGKSLSTSFNKPLAGIGLHAFALDNLLSGRGLNANYFYISQFVSLLLLLLVLFFFRKNKPYLYGVLLLLVLLSSYYLFTRFYIEINYAAFISPLLILLIVEVIFMFFEKVYERNKAYSENEILQKALSTKESKLTLLEAELDKTKEPPTELLNKIKQLKEEINQIKTTHESNETPYAPNSDTAKKNFFGIIYAGATMDKVVKIIEKVAPTDASILITGESGSGKELVANAIHHLSNRSSKEIVAFNCAAIPENLLESELFGHVKGAFTGASKDKIGRFEVADKGTIFLDEIGETSEKFQAKLLRVLQSGEFQKVGSTKTQIVDVRIIAATNRNLSKLVEQKEFREDLYYRLNVITIELPTLNERKEDVPFMAEYFANKEYEGLRISKSVMDVLQEHNWKGNVRELESQIKRAAIFAKADNRNIIQLCDIPSNLAKSVQLDLKEVILNLLREKKFSHSAISEIAKELGNISRTIVSENYRGIFFEKYIESDYDFDKAVLAIANSENKDVIEKISKKGKTYLGNIEKDLVKYNTNSFDVVRNGLASKYRNLPRKYHTYLDEIIKMQMEDKI